MEHEAFRAPAVPLLTNDPMFSLWSFADKLTDDTTRHWTGTRQFISGVISIDDVLYEFLGKVNPVSARYHAGYRKLRQVGVEIRPMSTVYTFECPSLRMELRFTSPLLLDDLEVLSRPVSYITYKLTALDGREHRVHIYFGFSAEFCVNDASQQVHVELGTESICFSSGTARMLKRSGDDHRIEWGSFHVLAPGHRLSAMSLRWFQRKVQMDQRRSMDLHAPVNYMDHQGPNLEGMGPEKLPVYEDVRVDECWPTIVTEEEFVLGGHAREAHITLGYDDVKAVQYFGENIDDYWKKDGCCFETMLRSSDEEYSDILGRVAAFENKLLERAGRLSPRYAQILSLAYRQAVAGHKLTWHGGELQFFSKENYSNGCMGTVDITYPSMPLFLLYNPKLVEGMLDPIFKLVEKGLWKYPFAPHDVGVYPLANGQAYGYTFRHRMKADSPADMQMPVEECGNMLLCVAALCAVSGSYDYFEQHIVLLRQWADYLVEIGCDPSNQLCTDDFAGHLAHNCNLSVKGICATAAFAKMFRATGRDKDAIPYETAAARNAKEWEKAAFDGDHYRLAFDQPGTWSIKYNMVWDRLLSLGLFSEDVYKREIAFYKSKMQPYGLPLDCRAGYTKSDWQMWSTVLSDDREYFEQIVDRMWRFLCETPDRVPFSDWYFTSSPIERGFQARTVQGGLFLNLLAQELLPR